MKGLERLKRRKGMKGLKRWEILNARKIKTKDKCKKAKVGGRNP